MKLQTVTVTFPGGGFSKIDKVITVDILDNKVIIIKRATKNDEVTSTISFNSDAWESVEVTIT